MITEIRTKDFPLGDGYKINMTLGIVKGKKGYIITESDLVHTVVNTEDEKIKLSVYKDNALFPTAQIEVSVKDMMEFVGEQKELKTWIHCFGIKNRIYQNYMYFQKSCKEIGAVMEFPEWERKR